MSAQGMSAVPESLLVRVKRGIAALWAIKERLDQVRSLDDRFGGEGRYEAETWASLTDEVTRYDHMRAIELLRTHAPAHGVDAEAVIAELGGFPDLGMSERALRYLGHEVR